MAQAENHTTPEVTIVLPTFNEANNVLPLLERIEAALVGRYAIECIFVDDSRDNTADIIRSAQTNRPWVKLVKREGEEAKTGLTRAFQRGFQEAEGKIIVCMDTDLQHPPESIPDLLKTLSHERVDVAVASRYTKGGSAEGLSNRYRHIVSRAASWFVWLFLPASRLTTDPMTGFFAFRKRTLDQLNLESYGFKILVELLVQMKKPIVVDVPFTFARRENEESKANPGQGVRFLKDVVHMFLFTPHGSWPIKHVLVGGGVAVLYALTLLFGAGEYWMHLLALVILAAGFSVPLRAWLFPLKTLREQFVSAAIWSLATGWSGFLVATLAGAESFWSAGLAVVASLPLSIALSAALFLPQGSRMTTLVLVVLLWILAVATDFVSVQQVGFLVVMLGYLLVVGQGLFALYLMLYAWLDESGDHVRYSPKQYITPELSFTAIVPCKHERFAIADTLRTLNRMSYPREMFEVLVVIHEGTDDGTIEVVKDTITELGDSGVVRLVTYNQEPVNKPHGLNYALAAAKGDVVVIFDAEDEPHPELFHIVNTEMLQQELDVLQSGVQLMNFEHRWFSLFNVLEYYFWFKSTLHFFSKKGVTTLGGVTVFFKRAWLNQLGGWDITCLTEDADIGIRLSQAGAKIGVVYDAKHATQEETPPNVWSFVKQRTRWAQGFLQIISRGVWRRFPTWKQRMLALYVLAWPFTLLALFLVFPVGIIAMFFITMPPTVAVLANIPLILFVMFGLVQLLGLYEFTREYNKSFPWLRLPLIIISFYPYTMLLAFAGLRAMYRNLKNNTSWEKTEHLNNHRASHDIHAESSLVATASVASSS